MKGLVQILGLWKPVDLTLKLDHRIRSNRGRPVVEAGGRRDTEPAFQPIQAGHQKSRDCISGRGSLSGSWLVVIGFSFVRHLIILIDHLPLDQMDFLNP